MAYFQDLQGGIHFLSEVDIANGGEAYLPDGCKAITDAQAEEILNPPKTQAQLAAENNDPIKAQLAELDGKSVRALHEAVLALAASGTALPADTVKRLTDLEGQKEALRAKLV